jgi:hypothetical protein
MGTFKNAAAVLGAVLALAVWGSSVHGAEINLKYRLPAATVNSNTTSMDYRYTFDTYDQAVAAMANWDANYYDAYMTAYKAWVEECYRIADEVEAKVRYKNLGKASILLPQKRFGELKSIIAKDVQVVERIVPDYEFPEGPDSGKPYAEAYCAYSQIISDGLTKYEWNFLRFALYDVVYFRKSGKSFTYGVDVDKAIDELAEKGLISVAGHKKGAFEKVAGSKGAKYDLEMTAKGKEYLNSLVERLWNFREGSAKEAYSREKITRAEYEQIQKDNKFLKEAYLKQIKKPSDWSGIGGTSDADELGKLFGKKSSLEEVKKAMRSFEVGDDRPTDPYPYTRVVSCVPGFGIAPESTPPYVLAGGTYVRDEKGNLQKVDLR